MKMKAFCKNPKSTDFHRIFIDRVHVHVQPSFVAGVRTLISVLFHQTPLAARAAGRVSPLAQFSAQVSALRGRLHPHLRKSTWPRKYMPPPQ